MNLMIDVVVAIPTSRHVVRWNAQNLLFHALNMNYIHTEPVGFVGDVSLLWGTSKVYVSQITNKPMHVLFLMKGMTYSHISILLEHLL